MKTAVFYSYKGGTGRTLALANIAAFAGLAGKRVVVIDMDLEAPGVAYKLLPQDQGIVHSPGLVGCLLHMIHTGELPGRLDDYLVPIDLGRQFGMNTEVSGSVWLMPAGAMPSPNYFGELRRLQFDARAEDGSAVDLMRGLVDKISADYAPDLLLIDSRTGVTSSNNLALAELADEVYAFFLDLPEQRDGVRMVLRSLAPLVRDGSPSVTAVLTRVPLEDEHIDAGWLETSADTGRTKDATAFLTAPTAPPQFTLESVTVRQLHHDPALVSTEQLLLLALDTPGVSRRALAWDYVRLAQDIIADAKAVAVVARVLDPNERDSGVRALIAGDPRMRDLKEKGAIRDLVDAGTGEELSLPERISAVRSAARRDPGYRSTLANLLLEFAATAAKLGQRTEALAPAEEAVALYRELAETDPVYHADLASALNGLGLRLSRAGQWTEALTPAHEAVTLYRELTLVEPTYRADLAMALNNLGTQLSEVGRQTDAIVPVEEAVTLYRELAETDPTHRTDLAMALNNLGTQLSEAGERTEALAAARETVTLYRELAETDPNRRTDLAMALNNLGSRLSEAGQWTEALAAAREAVTLSQESSVSDPAYRADLAMVLHNLGAKLSRSGPRAEAVPFVKEAVALYRELTDDDPTYLANLAGALRDLGMTRLPEIGHLTEVGAWTEAVALEKEAVALYRELTETKPAYFSHLADVLNTLGALLSLDGQQIEAVDSLQEAVALYRGLAENNPVYRFNLASALNHLGNQLSLAGQGAKAVSPIQEAVALYRELAENNPVYRPNLTHTLSNLGRLLSREGQWTRAADALQEAVALYRELAENNPVYRVNLADMLKSLREVFEMANLHRVAEIDAELETFD